MATHKALVAIGLPQGGMCTVNDLVNYSGPPTWKLEPLDADERAKWEKETADPAKVAQAIDRMPWTLREGRDRPETFDYILEPEGR